MLVRTQGGWSLKEGMEIKIRWKYGLWTQAIIHHGSFLLKTSLLLQVREDSAGTLTAQSCGGFSATQNAAVPGNHCSSHHLAWAPLLSLHLIFIETEERKGLGRAENIAQKEKELKKLSV